VATATSYGKHDSRQAGVATFHIIGINPGIRLQAIYIK
jgi:hypothetical protein